MSDHCPNDATCTPIKFENNWFKLNLLEAIEIKKAFIQFPGKVLNDQLPLPSGNFIK